MKKTFKILPLGTVDSTGDKFLPGSMLETEGVVLLLNRFDTSHPLGLICRVWEEEGFIMAEADIKDEWLPMTPAIGFKVLKQRRDAQGNRIIESFKLYSVGLCMESNYDQNIKPLNQQ